MSISNAVGTTSSASSGRRTITVRAINRLAVAEARLYSLCAASCATGQSVTLRQLAAVTGPTGHPIGLRPALDTVRDLVDSGLLTPTGLALATPDSPRHVHIPGCAVQAVPPAPVRAVPMVYAPPPTAGWIGRLAIPTGLPTDLRARLISIAAEIRSHNKSPQLPDAVLDVRRRKAAALTEWAADPEHATREVHEALSRALADEQHARKVHDQWKATEDQTAAALKAATARPTDELAQPPASEDSAGLFKAGLPIPAALPEDLRTELLSIANAFRGGGPADRAERMTLTERRTAALAQWATHPSATQKVISEAARAHKALENARVHC
ncbi:hypothetical protein [Streptomyces microflavus]|uniref:hypothetical protein n=1 Tax=Streptomyces microflavus TaxID=1919 RepID=UPI003B20ED4A